MIECDSRANGRCRSAKMHSPPMIAGIRSYLAASGLDVAREVRNGALALSSEQNHVVGGRFVIEQLLAMLEEAVDQALKDGYDGLWASGDMAWEFGSGRDFSRLLDYKRALEELFLKCPALSGVCQYHTQTLPATAICDGLYSHEAIYMSQTLSRLNPSYAGHRSPAGERPSLSSHEVRNRLQLLGKAIDR